jgi:hypothetical protein
MNEAPNNTLSLGPLSAPEFHVQEKEKREEKEKEERTEKAKPRD